MGLAIMVFIIVMSTLRINQHGYIKNFKKELDSDLIWDEYENFGRTLTSKEFSSLRIYNQKKKAIFIDIDVYRKHPFRLNEIRDDYQVYMPISRNESIEWTKNLNSDINLSVVCDKNDNRIGCDIRTHRNYDYKTLNYKTFDIIKTICKNPRKHKVYMKMDFDIFIDKQYINDVLSFMINNHKKRIYFGDPMANYNGKRKVAMNGKLYAITDTLMNDLCNCKIKTTRPGLEDYWFGRVLHKCLDKKKDKQNSIVLFRSNEKLIIHKKLIENSVKLQVGREIQT
ncbi:hypothetical protein BB558_006729 [Smittium angustum]|uniref:Hexosyltransferase n=1 Tax=Smittium angustum TaxID=133377 RepID=A0A2U1IWX8_SMIAN|nr:hypothetical protein BB558_006729 [Smittium angustum]